MLPPRTRASLLSVTVCLSLVAAPQPGFAGPPPEASSEDPPKSEGSKGIEPPPPTLGPGPLHDPSSPPSAPEGPNQSADPVDPPAPGIEFAVPPPEDDEEAASEAAAKPSPPTFQLPDPGMAPSDGVNMLVLGGTTLGLTAVGVTAGLIVGLDRGVDLEWLLPSTIVPAVGLLAFSGGGLYLGITRARAHRRWEIGYRVIGLPQGGGALIGGSITLLAALGLIPSGAVMLKGQPEWGATLIAVGSAAAVASPVMFVLGARNKRRYEQTGGWKRKPLPPMPPSPATSRLELRPLILPLPGGVSVGAGGRF